MISVGTKQLGNITGHHLVMGARDSSGEVLGRNMLTAAGQLGEHVYSCRSVGGICLQLQVSWGNIFTAAG